MIASSRVALFLALTLVLSASLPVSYAAARQHSVYTAEMALVLSQLLLSLQQTLLLLQQVCHGSCSIQ